MEKQKLSYEETEEKLKEILNNRLSNSQAQKFKILVKTLKENYGFSISKQYIKYTLFDDKSLNFQKVLSLRISRILKKAEIQTIKKPRFFKELKSEKGILYYEYRKKYFEFLII